MDCCKDYKCENCEEWEATEKCYGVCCLLGVSTTKGFFCANFEEKNPKKCIDCKHKFVIMDGSDIVGLVCKKKMVMYGEFAFWFIPSSFICVDDTACWQFERIDDVIPS